jgi:hypothetical protein
MQRRKKRNGKISKIKYHRDAVVNNLTSKNTLKAPVIIAGSMAMFVFARYSHLSSLTFLEPGDDFVLLPPVRTARSGGLFFLLECDFRAFLDIV